MTKGVVWAVAALCAAGIFAGCQQHSPAVTGATAAGPAGGKVYTQYFYTVQAGDKDFRMIAEKVYGDGKYWDQIQKANPSVDPTRLRAGQKLFIPTASQRERVIIPKHCNCQQASN